MATQRILVGIAAAATVVAGLAGCSSNKSGTSESSSNNAPAAGGTSAPAPGGSKVIIDGQTQNVAGQVSCTQVNGNLSIGIGDPTTGIGAVVTNADPPVVQAVGLGNLTGRDTGLFGRCAESSQRASDQEWQFLHDQRHRDGDQLSRSAAGAEQTIRDGRDLSLRASPKRRSRQMSLFIKLGRD